MRVSRVVLFILLTFGASWGFDLGVAALVGQSAYLDLGLSPLGMFLPASVALILQLFVFKDSPVYFRSYRESPRLIFFAFLFLTWAYAVITLFAAGFPGAASVLQGIGSLLLTLWVLLVFFIYQRSSKEALRRAGLQMGDRDRALRLVLGTVAFLILQAGLNLLLRLGEFQPPSDQIYGLPIPAGLYPLALIILFLAVAVIGTPLSGLAVVFGEEYGWRGFLQDELIKLGKLRGTLLVGLVWGVWHFPVILRGAHTYPPTALGLLLGLVFFVLWGIVQSYAVLKTGSIWVAAFLHGVVNSIYSFLLTYLVRPTDKVLSFGLGVFGLACLALVVVLILRDPLWRSKTANAPID